MLKVDSYSTKGIKGTAVTLPKEWEVKLVPKLLAQAIRVYDDRSHVGFAKTQGRGEVNRTTKKLYKQKGTGGARHGARSAPIFVGGGVAHGPKPRARELTLSQKMRIKALQMALNEKASQEKIVVWDLGGIKKTKDAATFLKKMNIYGKRVTFVLSLENRLANKALRNIANSKIVSFKNLNAHDVYLGGSMVMDKSIFKVKKEKAK